MFYYSFMTIVILQLNQSLRLVSGAAAILLAISNSNFNDFFFFIFLFDLRMLQMPMQFSTCSIRYRTCVLDVVLVLCVYRIHLSSVTIRCECVCAS